MMYFSLILIFLFGFNSVQSCEEGVTVDFKNMLKTPTATAQVGESFATYVTRPFIQDGSKDTQFFSDPKNSFPTWSKQYKGWSKKEAAIDALGVFETMGISRRGILLDPRSENYKGITVAQKNGMLGIIRGDLGFGDRSMTGEEEAIAARELLNIGYSLSQREVDQEIQKLNNLYQKEINKTIQKHLQISALFMLKGNDRLVGREEWYWDGIEGDRLLQKINDYAKQFLPVDAREEPVVAVGGAGVPSENILLKNCLKELVRAAKQAETEVSFGETEGVEKVYRLLNDNVELFKEADQKQASIIHAIFRMNGLHRGLEEAIESGYDPNEPFGSAKLSDKKILEQAYREFSPRAVSPSAISTEQRIQDYLDDSRILKMYGGEEKEELRSVFEEALKSSVEENDGKWPGAEQRALAEQFFWNLYDNRPDLRKDFETEFLPEVFKKKIHGNWQDFVNFCEPYLVEMVGREKPDFMRDLLPIYQAFPEATKRQAFLDFCGPYLVDIATAVKSNFMKNLLPIYQTFPDATERQAFIDLCKLNFRSLYIEAIYDIRETRYMKDFLPIYQAFPEATARQAFLDFCKPYLVGVYKR